MGLPVIFLSKVVGYCGTKNIDGCMDILNQRASIKDWNQTHRVLIPKVKQLQEVLDYRLISLCNVSYKVVTKAITNWVKPLLSEIILDLQLTFVAERSNTDNAIISHECLHFLKSKRKDLQSFSGIKLDRRKSFIMNLFSQWHFFVSRWWIILVFIFGFVSSLSKVDSNMSLLSPLIWY